MKPRDLNKYELSLHAYLYERGLLDHYDESFIAQRADEALDIFVEARRAGLDATDANELATISLMQDIGISLRDVLRDILEEEFAGDIPLVSYEPVLAELMEELEEEYEYQSFSYEFLDTPEGMAVKTELIGRVTEYLERYGL